MSKTVRDLSLALVMATTVAAEPWAAPGQGSSIYSCTDSRGRRLSSDRPISECIDREQKVLDTTGTVRRQIGPTLTEIERNAADERRRKEMLERSRQAEERRRESALVLRYPDAAAHELDRQAALEQVDGVMAAALKNIDSLRKDRKTLDTEMEFYAKNPHRAPAALRAKISENNDAMAEQRAFLTAREQDKRRINQRFDNELAQLKQLWGSPSSSAANPVR